ncbi:MAG: bifunctional biotin--[acetyl-CoA-carboxylase] ligase/biotin operon repressor BirA [Cellvibrionaceae bacterium]
MEVKQILELMADGNFHSGKVLGELLGVSRTAVWKHLQKLNDFGIELESVKGKGYRLPGGLELLDGPAMRAALSPEASSFLADLDLLQSTDSTNVQAMARASKSGAHGYLCMAEHQTHGRGRRGRAWVSPFGQSLYFSVVVEFSGGAAALEGLSLAVGVALARAVQKLGADGVGLKWPNDVLCGGRKLAGILLEMTGDPSGACQVVVGVGLNVSVSEAAAAAIDQPCVGLSELVPGVSRNDLAAEVLNELLPVLSRFHEQGFSVYREQWSALNVHAGKLVVLSTASESIEGEVVGVSATGALLLSVDGVIREFNGGEVTLRQVGV